MKPVYEIIKLNAYKHHILPYKFPNEHRNNSGYAVLLIDDSGNIIETLDWQATDSKTDDFLKEMNIQDWLSYDFKHSDAKVLIIFTVVSGGKGEDFEAWIEVQSEVLLRGNFKDYSRHQILELKYDIDTGRYNSAFGDPVNAMPLDERLRIFESWKQDWEHMYKEDFELNENTGGKTNDKTATKRCTDCIYYPNNCESHVKGRKDKGGNIVKTVNPLMYHNCPDYSKKN